MTYVYDGYCSRFFSSKGCIEELYGLLMYPDPKIVTVFLEGLKNILKAEVNKKRGRYRGVNIYDQMVDECG